ncbi:MAG: biotin transporter BioY [Hyphomicrobiales bacterium]
MNTASPTLANRLWPAASSNQALRAALLAILGSALVAACAQVSIPMVPVPMTLQTLAVLAIGGAYGSRLGAATLALYAVEGAAGLPVFANFQAGLFLPTGEIIATGGYIVGFVIAAGLVGWLAERGWDRSMARMFAATLLGAVVLYVPGLIWLTAWLVVLKGMTLNAATAVSISSGLIPFVWGDLLKAALAAMAFPAAWSLLGRR